MKQIGFFGVYDKKDLILILIEKYISNDFRNDFENDFRKRVSLEIFRGFLDKGLHHHNEW